MILAINANAALDCVLFVEQFVPNTHMRAQRTRLSVGGKGLDSALVLKTLQAPVHALSFMAGRNGETVADLLAQAEIETDLIWLAGDTRVSNVIVETGLNRHSHITTQGYEVNAGDCSTFLAKVAELAPSADWAIMAGTLPPGAPAEFYQQVIAVLHAQQVPVLIDSFGAPVRKALVVVPEIVKMNQAELKETFGLQATSWQEWLRVGQGLREKYAIPALVITCGKEGILAFTAEGVYHAGTEAVQQVNAAGAGDAVSAALAYRLSRGDGWAEALRWGVAASTAVVMTEGTAECYLKDILAIYPKAWVKKVNVI